MEESESKTESKKVLGAKDYSLFAQIISAVWIAAWDAIQFVRELKTGTHIDIWDIIISGVFIAGCFSPVFLSIILDKIKEIKNVNRSSER